MNKLREHYSFMENLGFEQGVHICTLVNHYKNKIHDYAKRDLENGSCVDYFDHKGLYGDRALVVIEAAYTRYRGYFVK